MIRIPRVAAAVSVALLLACCGVVDGGDGSGSDDNDERCSPGDTRSCVGPGACSGGQRCGSDGWGACECGTSGAGGTSGTGGTPPAGGSSGSDPVGGTSGAGGTPGGGGAQTAGMGGTAAGAGNSGGSAGFGAGTGGAGGAMGGTGATGGVGGMGAAGGMCGDTTSDWQNCGACGRACDNGGEYCLEDPDPNSLDLLCCTEGHCAPFWGPCFNEASGFANCDEACADVGETCVAAGCAIGANQLTWLLWADSVSERCPVLGVTQLTSSTACDSGFVWDNNDDVRRCCCTDTQ